MKMLSDWLKQLPVYMITTTYWLGGELDQRSRAWMWRDRTRVNISGKFKLYDYFLSVFI